jgi:endonuclease-3
MSAGQSKNSQNSAAVGVDAQSILATLAEVYANDGPALKYNSVYQLLIAVILSAQTNDNQVNKITEKLFVDYGTPEKMAELTVAELEKKIQTCGLYKNKAKNIIAANRMLLEEYGGVVPNTREELIKLPGVGRKTANVVLSVGFGLPALAVDTHIFRVAHRLGFSSGKTPDDVERDLCALIPEQDWAKAHHWFIWHGRRVCDARHPKCAECPLLEWCPQNL